MKFKAAKTKVVRIGKGKYATFESGTFETTNKDEIALLEKAINVKKGDSK